MCTCTTLANTHGDLTSPKGSVPVRKPIALAHRTAAQPRAHSLADGVIVASDSKECRPTFIARGTWGCSLLRVRFIHTGSDKYRHRLNRTAAGKTERKKPAHSAWRALSITRTAAVIIFFGTRIHAPWSTEPD